jgi:hypothetical protein
MVVDVVDDNEDDLVNNKDLGIIFAKELAVRGEGKALMPPASGLTGTLSSERSLSCAVKGMLVDGAVSSNRSS